MPNDDQALDAVRIAEDSYRLIEELSRAARGGKARDSVLRLAMKATEARAATRDYAFDAGMLPSWDVDPAGTRATGDPMAPWSREQRDAVRRVQASAERAMHTWSRGHKVRRALLTVCAVMTRAAALRQFGEAS